LKKAKYKLDFEVEVGFDIGRAMEVSLQDGSKIEIYESKGLNHGTIFFETHVPDETIARNEGQQKVEQFFNCMLIAIDRLENMKAISFPQKPELLNPEDFEGVIKTGYANYSVRVDLVHRLEQTTLEPVSKLLTELYRLPQSEQDIIFRSLRWFRKASETSGEDRFIFRWVSFEALLGLLNKDIGTQGLINEFINTYLERQTIQEILQKHKTIIERLSKANLRSWQGKLYSKPLQDSLEKGHDVKSILQKAALCVYQVRNDLFHKGAVIQLMEDSGSLLRDIIRECLKSYVSTVVGRLN